MRSAALIVNPRASRVTPAGVTAVMAELAAGGPVEKLVTERPGHARELAREASRRHDVLYVYSGDGGYNEAVQDLGSGVPIGFIPGGATSVLPRALGLPRNPVEAARRLARAEKARRISLGVVNGRRFTFCAGIGLDAELVRAVDGRGRHNGKRAHDVAFAWELGKIAARRRFRLVPALEVEGLGRAAFLVVANCDPYTYAGPFRVHATPGAQFELGIDAVGPRRLGPGGLAHLAWHVLVRPTHVGSNAYLHVHDADELVVRCDAPTALQVDGEDMGDVVDVVLGVHRRAIDVLS